MAVTADYCVIWESKVGDTYANGYFTTTTIGNGTGVWANPRFGSIYYMGLRETQPWENTLTNNPPWVCWQYTGDIRGTGTTSTPYSHNQVAAYMATMNQSGVTSANAKIYVTSNSYLTNRFFGGETNGRNTTEDVYSSNVNYYTPVKQLDGPIFTTNQMGNNLFNGETGNNSIFLYMPQYDDTTTQFIPCAYPIKISRCYVSDWNAGGACRGIYKSLSMIYTSAKLYWQASNQTFSIPNKFGIIETYLPFVLYNDMWLIRLA
jgi:hypothetical protein